MLNDTDDNNFGLHVGQVVANNDPDGLGRVKVFVPGLIDPASGWAYPLGTVGGGIANRGFFFVPEVGATVGVFFNGGDVDHPYYVCGHWGVTGDGCEVPQGPCDVDPADAPKVQAIETSRYLIVIDNRSGEESLVIKDKESDDQIELNAGEGINIKTSSTCTVEAADSVVNATTASVTGSDSVTVTTDGTCLVDASEARVEADKAVVDSADVNLGGDNLVELIHGVVNGSSVDTFTGQTFGNLGQVSTIVKANK